MCEGLKDDRLLKRILTDKQLMGEWIVAFAVIFCFAFSPPHLIYGIVIFNSVHRGLLCSGIRTCLSDLVVSLQLFLFLIM